jgi:Flp pilus assembly protein TadG
MRRTDRRGQGMVEFALMAPFVFLLFFGLFDLGGAVYTYNTLAHGTQTAASYASLHCGYNGSGYTSAQLGQQVLTAGQLLQTAQLSVSASPTNGNACAEPGKPITVTSTYLYHPLTPMMQAFFPQGGLSLQSSVEVLAQ